MGERRSFDPKNCVMTINGEKVEPLDIADVEDAPTKEMPRRDSICPVGLIPAARRICQRALISVNMAPDGDRIVVRAPIDTMADLQDWIDENVPAYQSVELAPLEDESIDGVEVQINAAPM